MYIIGTSYILDKCQIVFYENTINPKIFYLFIYFTDGNLTIWLRSVVFQNFFFSVCRRFWENTRVYHFDDVYNNKHLFYI